MLLIHMLERIGPGALRPDAASPVKIDERPIAFATRLPLDQALLRIRNYRDAFNRRHEITISVSFWLLSVTPIEDLDERLLQNFCVTLAENLKQHSQEFEIAMTELQKIRLALSVGRLCKWAGLALLALPLALCAPGAGLLVIGYVLFQAGEDAWNDLHRLPRRGPIGDALLPFKSKKRGKGKQ